MSAEEETQWKIFLARQALQSAECALSKESGFTLQDIHQLSLALAHAVRAWDRSYVEGNRPSHAKNYEAFFEAAPNALRQIVVKAQVALVGLRDFQAVSPTEAVVAMRIAVEAVLTTILSASSKPPSSGKCS